MKLVSAVTNYKRGSNYGELDAPILTYTLTRRDCLAWGIVSGGQEDGGSRPGGEGSRPFGIGGRLGKGVQGEMRSRLGGR